MENKKKSILPKLLQIITLVLMGIFSLTGLAAAYIIFAPDNLPKPFYLQYNYPTPIPTVEGTAGATAAAIIETPGPVHEVLPGEGIMINTGTKIINLSEITGKKYIRITIVIELAPNDPKYFNMTIEEKNSYITEFTTEISNKLPVIEDTLITLISTKSFEQLYTAEGKEHLRSDLSNMIMQRLPDYHVLSVYFTEFVVE